MEITRAIDPRDFYLGGSLAQSFRNENFYFRAWTIQNSTRR